MTWTNPIPNIGWFATEPSPVAIWFIQNVYAIVTTDETQYMPTLGQAMQVAHDMLLAQTAIIKGLSFESFFLDLPTDNQQIYVIDSSGVITTGIFSLVYMYVTPVNGALPMPISTLAGWCAP